MAGSDCPGRLHYHDRKLQQVLGCKAKAQTRIHVMHFRLNDDHSLQMGSSGHHPVTSLKSILQSQEVSRLYSEEWDTQSWVGDAPSVNRNKGIGSRDRKGTGSRDRVHRTPFTAKLQPAVLGAPGCQTPFGSLRKH